MDQNSSLVYKHYKFVILLTKTQYRQCWQTGWQNITYRRLTIAKVLKKRHLHRKHFVNIIAYNCQFLLPFTITIEITIAHNFLSSYDCCYYL